VADYKLKELILLEVGDFVVDPTCNEVGLLIMRFNLIEDEVYPIYAWDILWSCSRASAKGIPKRAPYTEESLKNMILEGALTFYKNN